MAINTYDYWNAYCNGAVPDNEERRQRMIGLVQNAKLGSHLHMVPFAAKGEMRTPYGGQYYMMDATVPTCTVRDIETLKQTSLPFPFERVPNVGKGDQIARYGALLQYEPKGGALAYISEGWKSDLFRGSVGFTGAIGVGKSTVIKGTLTALGAVLNNRIRPGNMGVGRNPYRPYDVYEHPDGYDYVLINDFDEYIKANLGPAYNMFPYHAYKFYTDVHVSLHHFFNETTRPFLLVWDRSLLVDGLVFDYMCKELRPAEASMLFRTCFGAMIPFVMAIQPRVTFLLHLDYFQKSDLMETFNRVQERGRVFEENLPIAFPFTFQAQVKAHFKGLMAYIPSMTLVQLLCWWNREAGLGDSAVFRYLGTFLELWASGTLKSVSQGLGLVDMALYHEMTVRDNVALLDGTDGACPESCRCATCGFEKMAAAVLELLKARQA